MRRSIIKRIYTNNGNKMVDSTKIVKMLFSIDNILNTEMTVLLITLEDIKIYLY